MFTGSTYSISLQVLSSYTISLGSYRTFRIVQPYDLDRVSFYHTNDLPVIREMVNFRINFTLSKSFSSRWQTVEWDKQTDSCRLQEGCTVSDDMDCTLAFRVSIYSVEKIYDLKMGRKNIACRLDKR